MIKIPLRRPIQTHTIVKDRKPLELPTRSETLDTAFQAYDTSKKAPSQVSRLFQRRDRDSSCQLLQHQNMCVQGQKSSAKYLLNPTREHRKLQLLELKNSSLLKRLTYNVDVRRSNMHSLQRAKSKGSRRSASEMYKSEQSQLTTVAS